LLSAVLITGVPQIAQGLDPLLLFFAITLLRSASRNQFVTHLPEACKTVSLESKQHPRCSRVSSSVLNGLSIIRYQRNVRVGWVDAPSQQRPKWFLEALSGAEELGEHLGENSDVEGLPCSQLAVFPE
jgi:hypothetical protein